MNVQDLFDELYSFYGPQRWWPGEGFEIAVGAILTQNTSWKNVEKALNNLHEKNLMSPINILNVHISVLEKALKPSGYFSQKASYLRNLCKLFIENPNPNREELLRVKGIGEETADSILLYLFNKPEFVIDSYTIRISNRLGLGNHMRRDSWKKFFENNIENKPEIFNEFHALLVKHAKTFCLKNNPKCSECFLSNKCEYGFKTIQK